MKTGAATELHRGPRPSCTKTGSLSSSLSPHRIRGEAAMQIQVRCGCGEAACPKWAVVEVQGVLQPQPCFSDCIQDLHIGRLCSTSSAPYSKARTTNSPRSGRARRRRWQGGACSRRPGAERKACGWCWLATAARRDGGGGATLAHSSRL
ncbi:hypothetical protein VPH35_072896 [Triticum aestivum]|uniref:Uncharacterized protein n=1 Tax=Triticum turgidum subsp. durum TaxID=4567 RepID=A0A9R0WBF4_TRITD|nr:unnamed protein product [Triticum turgidum subsp. durum]